MTRNFRRLLRCTTCRAGRVITAVEALERLQSCGHLRRSPNCESEIVWEIYQQHLQHVPEVRCECCGAARWQLEDPGAEDEDSEDWGQERLCEACGRPIPLERLEALAHATRCVRCQRSGDEQRDRDFCPRCGAELSLQTRSAGIARYVERCSACGWQSS